MYLTMAMANTEDTSKISDKVWILVGMLLRNGQSCTPSQLSDCCHLLKITASEIEWLCKLPFSPLCLSQCGQATFSHCFFNFFYNAKERYAIPSMAFVSRNCSFVDSVSASIQKAPFPLSLLRGPTAISPPYQQNCDSLEMQLRRACSHVAGRDGQVTPIYTHDGQFSRKRQKEMIFLPPNKKQNISITARCLQTVVVKEMTLSGSEIMSSSMVCSTPRREGEEYYTIRLALKSKEFQAEKQGKLTKCASCHTQQSCIATTTCPAENTTEIDQDNSVDLVPSKQKTMHDTTKDEGKGLRAVIKKKSAFDVPIELVSLPHYHDSSAIQTADVACCVVKQESLQDSVAGPKSLDHIFEYRNLVEDDIIQGNNLNFALRTPIDDCKECADLSFHDISRGTAEVCCSRLYSKANPKSKLRHNSAENDEHGFEPPLSKQSKGKIIKGSRHKIGNGKQASKISKIKKATRQQAALAGGSAVVEVCSNQPVEDKYPSFDGFIVEAVEGSGGYGTVYKAVRKTDGLRLAIKYPFERTSGKHVQNEIKVLQKYGGQNFIPKCLEVIEESGRQCLVLEYIEHEKPEILRKEISISQLQSYGFSLFKALEYLHSKGIIHRDVKPGNFLFSRKKKCGWLVDFNLAMVQLKQSSSGSKSRKHAGEHLSERLGHKIHQRIENTPDKAHRDAAPEHQSKSSAYSSSMRIKPAVTGQEKISTPSGTPTRDVLLYSPGTYPTSSQGWKHAENTPNHLRYKLQAPDFSAGRASPANRKLPPVKEAPAIIKAPRLSNSNTHRFALKDQGRLLQNGDPLNADQVLPRYGRRELWELVHKTQQSPQSPVASLPSSHKKRVAAPQKRKYQKAFMDQGLPQSSTLPGSKLSCMKTPINGYLPKARGMQKMRKEGPCAGTKGYRAPEVLLKSVFQTEKLDVWSAGVSVFQLLLGKSPFSSSSNLEQSLLDIAQFCGADAICTLAKEHSREVSLSKELNSSKVQPSSVHLWCEKNTKRPDILSLVPPSLFDLLEKCLQIDPQKRISAKEALQHEFFSPCQNSLT